MNSYKRSDKPRRPPLRSVRLLDQVRERIRYLHYSLSTEKVYVHWITLFIRWHGRDGAAMRHPREMGAGEVQAFFHHAWQRRNALFHLACARGLRRR